MSKNSPIKKIESIFLKLYASVPDKLRGEVIAVVNDKTYSWNSAYIEVSGGTVLGERILKKLDEIGLFKEG